MISCWLDLEYRIVFHPRDMSDTEGRRRKRLLHSICVLFSLMSIPDDYVTVHFLYKNQLKKPKEHCSLKWFVLHICKKKIESETQHSSGQRLIHIVVLWQRHFSIVKWHRTFYSSIQTSPFILYSLRTLEGWRWRAKVVVIYFKADVF